MEERKPPGASGPSALITRYIPGFIPSVIFDVGANVGQSVKVFADAFPEAAIYAFEPVGSVFRTLAAAIEGRPRVQAFNVALSRRLGRAHITNGRTSVSNRIVESPNVFDRRRMEAVAVTSGDAFAAEHGIDRVGFLKIDAEGHDLDVLIGFQRMLTEGRVDLLEAEVGMNRANRRHVPFEAVKAYLEPLGYHLFHIHDQSMDTPLSGRIVLRRANAMFISDALVEKYRTLPS
jgi:FkbM family methyltransferase